MTTTSAQVESVPGFWKKCWNALMRFFKRKSGEGTASAEKVEHSKPQEREATA